MAIVGLGTDLVETARFRRFLDDGKTALLARLFTAEERRYAMQKKDPAPHLAARFAAKEAGAKAFGTGIRHGLRWLDMEVVTDAFGRPELRLTGRAAERAAELGVDRTHLSYSHDGGFAVATVIMETS